MTEENATTSDATVETPSEAVTTPTPVWDLPESERPTISYSHANKAVKKLFGHRGRIWRTPEGYALGIDTQPGRRVLVTGPDLWFLLFGRYEPPGAPRPAADANRG